MTCNIYETSCHFTLRRSRDHNNQPLNSHRSRITSYPLLTGIHFSIDSYSFIGFNLLILFCKIQLLQTAGSSFLLQAVAIGGNLILSYPIQPTLLIMDTFFTEWDKNMQSLGKDMPHLFEQISDKNVKHPNNIAVVWRLVWACLYMYEHFRRLGDSSAKQWVEKSIVHAKQAIEIAPDSIDAHKWSV